MCHHLFVGTYPTWKLHCNKEMFFDTWITYEIIVICRIQVCSRQESYISSRSFLGFGMSKLNPSLLASHKDHLILRGVWMMNERIADLRGRYHQNIPSRELTYPQAAGTFEDDVLLSLTKMGIYVSFQEFTAVFFVPLANINKKKRNRSQLHNFKSPVGADL